MAFCHSFSVAYSCKSCGAIGCEEPEWKVIANEFCPRRAFDNGRCLKCGIDAASIPSILEIAKTGGSEERDRSFSTLRYMGTAAKDAVPILLEMLSSNESYEMEYVSSSPEFRDGPGLLGTSYTETTEKVYLCAQAANVLGWVLKGTGDVKLCEQITANANWRNLKSMNWAIPQILKDTSAESRSPQLVKNAVRRVKDNTPKGDRYFSKLAIQEVRKTMPSNSMLGIPRSTVVLLTVFLLVVAAMFYLFKLVTVIVVLLVLIGLFFLIK